METVGGGEIIEPVPLKKKRFDNNLIEELRIKEKGSSTDVIEKIIRENSKNVPTVAEIAKITALSENEIKLSVEILEDEEKITSFSLKNDKYLWHKSFEREIEESIEKYLFDFHEKNKYVKGAKKSEIKSRYLPKLKQNVFDLAINSFVEKGFINQQGEFISLPYFQIAYDDIYKNIESITLKALVEAKYEFIKQEELVTKINNNTSEQIIALMLDDKKLIKINEVGITTQEIYNDAKNILIEYIKKNLKITAAEYRDLLNTNRKIAIALLEYFDMQRVTKRVGNDRVLF